MKELAGKAFDSTNFAPPKPFIRINCTDSFGLRKAPFTRLFFFSDATPHFTIDFLPQKIVPGSLYVVPPDHVYFLATSPGCDFAVIDLDDSLMKPFHKQLLYKIKYNRQKEIPVLDAQTDSLSIQSLKFLADGVDLGLENATRLLGEWIDKRIPRNFKASVANSNFSHHILAENLVGILEKRTSDMDECKIGALAAELCCSERNLHRICTSVFGIGTKQIVQYHITSMALWLLSDYKLSLNEVAYRLSFTSAPSFNHFIRKSTGKTPTEIRYSFRMAGIW